MKYYKYVSNGYILIIGIGSSGSEITKSEYDTIINTLRNKPIAESGYDYRLRENLTWEQYKLPDPDSELYEPTIEDKARN